METAEYWDGWWREKVAEERVGWYRSGVVEAPLAVFRDGFWDVASSPQLLIVMMQELGLRSVLHAGAGISREPLRLARAGFETTAVDISPVAIELLRAMDAEDGGAERLQYVVGDFVDPAVCPGPYDVIVERRTTQLLGEPRRAAALQALAARLKPRGIFYTHCNDSKYPGHGRKLQHACEPWFRQRGWSIWNRVPEPPLNGQVAWLVHSAS